MVNTVVMLREKRLSYGFFFLPRKFSNDGERQAQVSTFFSLQLTIEGFTLLIQNIALCRRCVVLP